MVYPNAQIITVEPDKHNFAANKMNTHRFPNVHAVNAGLWDKQTYIDLMASEVRTGVMDTRGGGKTWPGKYTSSSLHINPHMCIFTNTQGEWGYMFKEVPSGEHGAVFGTTINHLMRRFRFPRIDFAKVCDSVLGSFVWSDTCSTCWCPQLSSWGKETPDQRLSLAHRLILKAQSRGSFPQTAI